MTSTDASLICFNLVCNPATLLVKWERVRGAGRKLPWPNQLARVTYALVVQTVAPERGLAVELHSTFVGHDSAPTKATHLVLGLVGYPAEIVTREDELGIVDMFNCPTSCVYTHCCELTAMLGERDLDLKVDRMPSQTLSLPR